MENYSLEMKNITKTFGKGHTEVDVLKGINFNIRPGEFVSIIGPSGSGKSTFLTIAGGLQTPSEGQILINNNDFSNLPEKARSNLRLQDIGFILQSTNLIPFLNIREQFIFMDKVRKRAFHESKLDRLLKSLDVEHLKKSMPRDLSGGEKQRVAIGTALYSDPAVILADEPTASLDTDHAYEVVKLLVKEAHEKNKATIMVTHDPRMVDYSDTVYKMTDGRLVKDTHNGQNKINNTPIQEKETITTPTSSIESVYKTLESIGIDQINDALRLAETKEEREFYMKIARFMLEKRQKEIIGKREVSKVQ